MSFKHTTHTHNHTQHKTTPNTRPGRRSKLRVVTIVTYSHSTEHEAQLLIQQSIQINNTEITPKDRHRTTISQYIGAP